jgi:hypothetical protein
LIMFEIKKTRAGMYGGNGRQAETGFV